MADSHKDVIVALLREVLRQVQSLDEEELVDVVAGKGTFLVRIETTKRSVRSARVRTDDNELQQLGKRLKECRTREEGIKVLAEKVSSKDEVIRLARSLDLPTQKDDNLEQLRAKIIESTIGFRLRSAAIQGTQAANGLREQPSAPRVDPTEAKEGSREEQ
jgi:Holliday junction resolvase